MGASHIAALGCFLTLLMQMFAFYANSFTVKRHASEHKGLEIMLNRLNVFCMCI